MVTIINDGDASAAVLDAADVLDFHSVVTQLKVLVGKLCNSLAKGRDMGLDSKENRRLRDWPRAQIKKLQWHFLEEGGVDALIQKIHFLTQHLPSLYLNISK